MNRNLIIADDFTGANDTGVQLSRKGFPTGVVFCYPEKPNPGISYVLDSESRGLTGEEAYQKVSKDIKNIDFSDFRYVIKKVDSTLRGNVPEEIRAVDEAYQSELVLFMPALPDLGRTTVKRIHMLGGVPVTQTEIARDPKKPVVLDDIRAILETVYEEPVEHIDIASIESGQIDLTRARVYSADAETNAHMQAVIRAAAETGKRVLYVGTAAMADNLLALECPARPAMGLIASVSAVTNAQVKYAEAAGARLISVPVYELFDDEKKADVYVTQALEALCQGTDTLVLSSASYDRSELDRTVEEGVKRGMIREEVSVWTQYIMGYIGNEVLKQAEVAGLFLTGGDTAIGFFHTAGAIGSRILGEVAVGIPLMRLIGGHFDGMKVITKAGAFGKEDAISYGLRKLKEVEG